MTPPIPLFDVLRFLIRTGPVRTAAITSGLNITTGAAGRALRVLRARGFVRLEYGPGGTHVPAVSSIPPDLFR